MKIEFVPLFLTYFISIFSLIFAKDIDVKTKCKRNPNRSIKSSAHELHSSSKIADRHNIVPGGNINPFKSAIINSKKLISDDLNCDICDCDSNRRNSHFDVCDLIFLSKNFNNQLRAIKLENIELETQNQKYSIELALKQPLNDYIEQLTLNLDLRNQKLQSEQAQFQFHQDQSNLIEYYQSNFVYFPIDFQIPTLNFSFTNYKTIFEVADNPRPDGVNNSTKVGRFRKTGLQAKSSIILSTTIDFSVMKRIKMNFFSSTNGIKVELIFLNPTWGGDGFKTFKFSTKVNEWEELIFDFVRVPLTQDNYQQIDFCFDMVITNNGTYYIDNLVQYL